MRRLRGRRAAVPPGPCRRGRTDRLPLLRQLLRRVAARGGAQRPLRPHRRAAARRSAGAHRGDLGRRSPTSSRRSVASSAAPSSCCSPSPRAPLTAVIAARAVPRLPAVREQRHRPGHRGQRGEPHPAGDDAGRPRRRRGGRRARAPWWPPRCSAPARRSTSSSRGELPPPQGRRAQAAAQGAVDKVKQAAGEAHGQRQGADGVGRRRAARRPAARPGRSCPAPGAVVIDVRPPWARTSPRRSTARGRCRRGAGFGRRRPGRSARTRAPRRRRPCPGPRRAPR